MTSYALDYSAGRPSGAAVRAAGYSGVLRYVGFDPAARPKCITRAEYESLIGAGVGVGLVYENVAGDALNGQPAGVAAGQRARHWADVIGFPRDRPLYFACDTDVVTAAQFAAVLDYLRGAATALGGVGLVGVYGENDVIERAAAAGVARWFWQTKAWSHGVVSPRAHLLQLVGTVFVAGVGCDRNEIHQSDWGQAGAVAPPPPPPPPPPRKDPEMITIRRDDGAAFLLEPHAVRGISAAQLAAYTKAGLPTADGLTDAQITALRDGMGDEPVDAVLIKLTALAAQLAALRTELDSIKTSIVTPTISIGGPYTYNSAGTVTLTPEAP